MVVQSQFWGAAEFQEQHGEDVSGKLVADDYGLLSINYGLLEANMASCLGLVFSRQAL